MNGCGVRVWVCGGVYVNGCGVRVWVCRVCVLACVGVGGGACVVVCWGGWVGGGCGWGSVCVCLWCVSVVCVDGYVCLWCLCV